MDAAAVKTKLNAVFQDIFSNDSLQISEGMTAADVAGWDSLSHINLILGVEKAFGIRLTTREARGMKNVGDFIDLVASKAT